MQNEVNLHSCRFYSHFLQHPSPYRPGQPRRTGSRQALVFARAHAVTAPILPCNGSSSRGPAPAAVGSGMCTGLAAVFLGPTDCRRPVRVGLTSACLTDMRFGPSDHPTHTLGGGSLERARLGSGARRRGDPRLSDGCSGPSWRRGRTGNQHKPQTVSSKRAVVSERAGPRTTWRQSRH